VPTYLHTRLFTCSATKYILIYIQSIFHFVQRVTTIYLSRIKPIFYLLFYLYIGLSTTTVSSAHFFFLAMFLTLSLVLAVILVLAVVLALAVVSALAVVLVLITVVVLVTVFVLNLALNLCWVTSRPKCEHTLEQSYSGMYSIFQQSHQFPNHRTISSTSTTSQRQILHI